MIRWKRGSRDHHLHQREDAELNLIPLIDILSVMVAFLLVYSVDVEVVQNSKGVEIPQSTADAMPNQSVVVMITAMLPTQVTPEVLAELEKDKERRELIARVSGNPAARFADPVIFPAERQQVTLSRKTLKLQAHECELLDEMATSVFREIGVEVVRRNANCDRTQQSLMPPEMVVETWMAAKPKPLDVKDVGWNSTGVVLPQNAALDEAKLLAALGDRAARG